MAKLVEILARELKEWPEGAIDALQRQYKKSPEYLYVYFYGACGDDFDFIASEEAEDSNSVTRAQWEAERARIERHSALVEASMMELEEAERARQLAESSKFTESDKAHIQELAAIACGKRSKEDQELWDKVAAEAVGGLAAKQWNDYAVMVEHAAGIADLFMQERAKRMENNQ